MADPKEFMQQLYAAVESKTEWYDTKKLQEVLSNYRIVHSCVKSIYDLMIQKSKITKDPYKLDKKFSEVVAPDDSYFNENEKAVIFGTRFSDYESMLDFLCSYFNFSVSYMTLERIKNLVALNNAFAWNNLSMNSTSPNTRALAEIIIQMRQELDQLSANTLNSSVSKCAQLLNGINLSLKELTEFQHEIYKVTVRKNIFDHPGFNIEQALTSPQNEMAAIKKIFPAVMGKIPFYTQLIEEIIQEDQGAGKDAKQAALLSKLQTTHSETKKKVEKVDSKQILLESIQLFGSISPTILQIGEKLKENHEILENQANTGWEKFMRVLRKAFNLAEPEVEYQVYITDPVQKTERKETIKYVNFLRNLIQTARYFGAVSTRANPAYKKLESDSSDNIMEFLNKNLSNCQKLLTQLSALDDFFKSAVHGDSSAKIKGMKMDLTTLKNQIVKVNQRRVEYMSVIEEEQQLKKLGISNAD